MPLVSVGGQCAVRAVSPGVPLTLAIIQPDTYSSRTDLANAVLTQESTRWSNIHDTMPLMKIRSTAAQQWPGIYREMRIFKEAQGRKVQGAVPSGAGGFGWGPWCRGAENRTHLHSELRAQEPGCVNLRSQTKKKGATFPPRVGGWRLEESRWAQHAGQGVKFGQNFTLKPVTRSL